MTSFHYWYSVLRNYFPEGWRVELVKDELARTGQPPKNWLALLYCYIEDKTVKRGKK